MLVDFLSHKCIPLLFSAKIEKNIYAFYENISFLFGIEWRENEIIVFSWPAFTFYSRNKRMKLRLITYRAEQFQILLGLSIEHNYQRHYSHVFSKEGVKLDTCLWAELF